MDEAVTPPARSPYSSARPPLPGSQRLMAGGRPADLALLRAGPLEVLHSLAPDLVTATFIGRELIYVRS